MELTLDALHRPGRVVAEEELQVMRERGAEPFGLNDLGDRAEAERFLRIHQLTLVALVKLRFFRLEPIADFTLGGGAGGLIEGSTRLELSKPLGQHGLRFGA